MEPRTMSWTTEAEAAIRALPDVQGVRIAAQGDEVRELHVVTSSERPLKHIARDIVTLLIARFDRRVDYRVVSVVRTRRGAPVALPPPTPDANGHGDPVLDGAEPGARTHPNGAPAATAASARRGGVEDRIRFVSVNVFVTGARAQAQVELRWRGVVRLGNASGWSTRDGAHRLVAAATVSAAQQYLADEVAIGVEDVQAARLGRNDAFVVALALISHRQEKALVGCCMVDHDPQRAVVLATLSALNRVVGGLRLREPPNPS